MATVHIFSPYVLCFVLQTRHEYNTEVQGKYTTLLFKNAHIHVSKSSGEAEVTLTYIHDTKAEMSGYTNLCCATYERLYVKCFLIC